MPLSRSVPTRRPCKGAENNEKRGEKRTGAEVERQAKGRRAEASEDDEREEKEKRRRKRRKRRRARKVQDAEGERSKQKNPRDTEAVQSDAAVLVWSNAGDGSPSPTTSIVSYSSESTFSFFCLWWRSSSARRRLTDLGPSRAFARPVGILRLLVEAFRTCFASLAPPSLSPLPCSLPSGVSAFRFR
uniref:Uncharacterized protein n=1 Tax=Toxoplasma gondii COUG TaxID=1074873 RepID=A0A2G8Y107_TOXGO|nr:hypothetical protein TGCOUG_393360 [Toxoplasma gondii COUG]